MVEQSGGIGSSKKDNLQLITNVDSEAQVVNSFQEKRSSNSLSRSYYSSPYKADFSEDTFASYTQDQDSIRNHTLALADQGLRVTIEETINTKQDAFESPVQTNGFQSNLSQLINEHGRPRNKLTTSNTSKTQSPQIPTATVSVSELGDSDEEDFEQDLVPPTTSLLTTNTATDTTLVNQLSNRTALQLSLPEESLSLLENNSSLTSNYQTISSNSRPNNKTSVEDTEQTNPFFTIFDEVCKEASFTSPEFWSNTLSTGFTSIPAVLIGTMLNVLDAVSFGVIIFPTTIPIFSDFGPDGIAIFLVSTVIAQLVFSAGGSRFGGGNGGFMIEVIPFFHIICRTIIEDVGGNQDMVIPTTMVAYALSTIVTGLVFLCLGWFKLGSLMEFFPRHILIGCIGGVGLFLMTTGFELTTKITPGFSLDVWMEIFSFRLLPLWLTPFLLALVLQVLTRFLNHSFLAPTFFLTIPIVFYVIVTAAGIELPHLRTEGWLFPLPTPVKPFYDFYLNFSFYRTSWSTLPKLIPIILSLTFFGILHVPINVPALAVSTGVQNIDINRELVSHGVSNILSGCFGSVQNYLIYSNSVLFIRSGGGSRVAGLCLCFTTFVVLLMGPSIIGFIPTSLVGALIFHMGIELMKEALFDPYNMVHPLEYLTILLIVVTMGMVGFTEGIFLGIVLACLFFVVIYSHRSPVRAIVDGTRVRSKVRRLYHQRTFLETVGDQVQVVYLQGFMFFGTVHQLDHAISNLLRSYKFRDIPIRFLILDFSLVNGIDFSASDAFCKIFHRLTVNRIYLLIAGAPIDSDLCHALRNAGIWSNGNLGNSVQHFEKCNQALEWCENTLLSTFYQMNITPSTPKVTSNLVGAYPALEAEYSSSPRDKLLQDAAVKVHQQVNDSVSLVKNARQPLGLLIQAFQEISDINYPSIHQLSQYFERIEMARDQLVWNMGDESDALYMIEKGLLRINVKIATLTGRVSATDSALPGTLVGEVTFLTNHHRTASAFVDSDSAVLWKLSRQSYARILEVGARHPSSPEAHIPFLLTKLALTYSAYDNRLYSDMELI